MKKSILKTVLLAVLLTLSWSWSFAQVGQEITESSADPCYYYVHATFSGGYGNPSVVPANTKVCMTLYFPTGNPYTQCNPGFTSDQKTPFTYDFCHSYNPNTVTAMVFEVYYANGGYYHVFLPLYMSNYTFGMGVGNPVTNVSLD